jgi:RNA polymerase sigma-70 factor (ECF subfamily)
MLDSKEKELIRRLKRGDRDALRRVYEKYRKYLLVLAFSLLYDKSLAEDALHDVFVKFAECVVKLKLRESLKNYLRACVVNRIRDIQRRPRKQAEGIRSTSWDWANPCTQATIDDELQRVDRAMAQLPFEQREVIILHEQEDMKFKEIALFLDISVNTVSSRYRRGMKKLQTMLDCP